MVADTKSISAMHQSGSKSTPATRPSRFLSRQILKPMRRNADASQLSTSHGTCSVRRLARLLGVRQRATSKTAWIGDGRLGSSLQHGGTGRLSTPLSAGLANELVARIAQDAGRIGRSAFKGRVTIGIKNAAVIAEGPARDNHARALKQPTLD